nr:MAG TPA: hypothetical protein [Caudoviricetes sp.]
MAEPEKARPCWGIKPTCGAIGIPPQSYPHRKIKPHTARKPPYSARHNLNKYYTIKTTDIL